MASDLSSFGDQVVLVVGAASGIGRAAAHLIASRGGFTQRDPRALWA